MNILFDIQTNVMNEVEPIIHYQCDKNILTIMKWQNNDQDCKLSIVRDDDDNPTLHILTKDIGSSSMSPATICMVGNVECIDSIEHLLFEDIIIQMIVLFMSIEIDIFDPTEILKVLLEIKENLK